METLRGLLTLLCVLAGAQTQVQRRRFEGKFAETFAKEILKYLICMTLYCM